MSAPGGFSPASASPVVVVGGGIVGAHCALALRAAGRRVVLLSAGAPEDAAAHGNAGCLAFASCAPLSLPGMMWQAPRWLLDPLGPLVIRWRHAACFAPWGLAFLRAGSRARAAAASRAMRALMDVSDQAWRETLRQHGLTAHVRWPGCLAVYETQAGYEADAFARQLLRAAGVTCEDMTAAEARAREPALGPRVVRAVRYPWYGLVSDPRVLWDHLRDAFAADGGVHISGCALDFERDAATGRVTAVRLEDGRRLPCAMAVVAAGAWSAPLAARLGVRVPLEAERGYNATLPAPGVALRGPVTSGEGHFFLTPLACGLRVGGAAEFAGLDAPPNFRRADALVRRARRLLPGLRADGARRWMGARPSLPDSLPALGFAPDTRGTALLAFGNSHWGLTQSAGMGRLVAQLAGGAAPDIDISPFRPDRFSRAG